MISGWWFRIAQIVLIAQHLKRIAVERLHTALGHGEGVVFKVDLAAFLVFFIDREIDDPREGKAVFISQAQLIADHRAGASGHGFKRLWLAP